MSGLAKAEIVGGKIVLATEGMHWETARDMCRLIPGGRWNKEKRWQTYDLDIRVCHDIRKAVTKYGVPLQIGPELSDWARAETERLLAAPDVNSKELVDLPKIRTQYPVLWGKMQNRPFQTVGVKFAQTMRQTCLADDPGLGKTLQSMSAMVEEYDDGLILVIAPKSAATNVWPKEIRRWLGTKNDTVVNLSDLTTLSNRRKSITRQVEFGDPGELEVVELPSPREVFLKEAGETMENAPGRVWVIIGEHWVRIKAYTDKAKKKFLRNEDGSIKMDVNLPLLFEFTWSGVIIDESHKVVIANTGNRCRHTNARFGISELDMIPNGMKMALSGTPMRGKSENMWGTLNWLRPKYYTSYWKWMDKNFEAFDNQSDPFGPDKVFGSLIDEKQFYESMKDVFIRRTKEEVAADLPPKMYGGEPLEPDDENSPVGVWLEMNPKQAKIYAQMEKDGATDDGIISNGILAEWTRLKQFSNSACVLGEDGKVSHTYDSNKLDWILEFLDDRGILDGSGENKVIISSQFSGFIDMVERKLNDLKVESFKLTGGTSGQKRIQMNDRFQEPGGPKVFLMTTTAGGVALTLDAADDVVICDETWVPDDQLQVEDRAHRLSRTDHNVTIWYLRSRNAIEEHIARVTWGRENEVRGIMDRSRGVVIKKKIAERMAK